MTGSRQAARRTLLYIAVFPFSFYFGQVYSEATFLLFTVLAHYRYRPENRGRKVALLTLVACVAAGRKMRSPREKRG